MSDWFDEFRRKQEQDDDIQVLSDSRARSPMRLFYGRLPSPPPVLTSRGSRERSPLQSNRAALKPSDYGGYPSSSRRYSPSPPKFSNLASSSYGQEDVYSRSLSREDLFRSPQPVTMPREWRPDSKKYCDRNSRSPDDRR